MQSLRAVKSRANSRRILRSVTPPKRRAMDLFHGTYWSWGFDALAGALNQAFGECCAKTRQVGLEPTTSRLTAGCSTIELLPKIFNRLPGSGCGVAQFIGPDA